ncbi:Death-associated protein kinase 2 [Portunus trituberculatus]|uniref:Death-associated protein kinase 2 n=1 Tax=Portunus trituberculatus TaxID=210409 RepID=A0A5B7CJ38_PORTR|nr:Death-associated protein kinase 2 [Portunus trituberculatus]
MAVKVPSSDTPPDSRAAHVGQGRPWLQCPFLVPIDSVVKRCQRNSDGVEVAVKFVRRARQERPATEREYLLLRRLQHPSLIRSIALYNATPKFDILVLELIMGLPLLDWIFTREETTESECAVLVKQVVQGLQYLHSSQVAYLDLKPENLLVDILRTKNEDGVCSICPDESLPAVRLIDFGNARSVCEKTPSEKSGPVTPVKELVVPPECPPLVLGSPEFMSPEILARKNVGIPADYWGLGVLIYVLVSGRSPFLGASPEATCRNILAGDLRFPVEYFASVTQEACDLIHDLLAYKPEDRVELQDALSHQWFNMEECESVLPIQSLADYSFRRSKVASSVQIITPQSSSK